jgi:hypothetical protein
MWRDLRESPWFGKVVQVWILSVGLLVGLSLDWHDGTHVWSAHDEALALAFIALASVVVPALAIWDSRRRRRQAPRPRFSPRADDTPQE